MSDDNRKQLRELTAIKDDAEQRLYRRLEFGILASRTMYAVIVGLVVAAVWLTGLQLQVGFNTRAIEKLWKETFHTLLP